MSTLGIYPEWLVPEHLFFQWIGRTKMHCIYQRILKEVKFNQKYLRCTDLQDNKFRVFWTAIALYKVDLVCAEIVKAKPIRNDAGLLPIQKKNCWYMVR